MRMDKLTSKFQMALAEAQSRAVGLDPVSYTHLKLPTS